MNVLKNANLPKGAAIFNATLLSGSAFDWTCARAVGFHLFLEQLQATTLESGSM